MSVTFGNTPTFREKFHFKKFGFSSLDFIQNYQLQESLSAMATETEIESWVIEI